MSKPKFFGVMCPLWGKPLDGEYLDLLNEFQSKKMSDKPTNLENDNYWADKYGDKTFRKRKQPTMNKEQEDWKEMPPIKIKDWEMAKRRIGYLNYQGLINVDDLVKIIAHLEEKIGYNSEVPISVFDSISDEERELWKGLKIIQSNESLQQENASLQNQNTLLQEDNLAMSKVIAEYKLLDKMNEKM